MPFPEPGVWWLVALRWLSYAATIALVGFTIAPALGRQVDRWRVAVAAGASLLLATRAGLLAGQAWLIYGPEPIDRTMIATVAFETRWGDAWLAQAGAALATLLGALLGGRHPRAARYLAATGVLAACIFLPATGHAAEQTMASRAMVQQALHVIAAGCWIGGLAAMWVATGVDDAAGLAEGLKRFSRLALVSAGTLAVSGALSGWSFLGSFEALLGTEYGRTLAIKLAFVAAVAGLGAYNWKRVLPRLLEPGGVARLRRTAALELALALLATVATAVLVGLPKPGG